MKRIAALVVVLVFMATGMLWAGTILGAQVEKINAKTKKITLRTGAEDVKTYKISNKVEVVKSDGKLGEEKVQLSTIKAGDRVSIDVDEKGIITRLAIEPSE